MKFYGLTYAPRECKYFCCGDCVIQYNELGDFKTCMIDIPDCKLGAPKENEDKQQDG